MTNRIVVFTSLLFVLLFVVVGGWWYLGDRQSREDLNSPLDDDTMQPISDTDATAPTGQQTAESPVLPQNWTRFYDGSLQYSLAYPADWTVRPATHDQGESAVLSFDPAETPDTGGIPSDQIKVAVTFFAPDDPREIAYANSEIMSEEAVTVDGYAATRREIQDGIGGSVATEVITPQGTYLISAYPVDSELMATYDQALQYIDLDLTPPVRLTQPGRADTVSSPVTITGSASGTWFFEGQLPVRIETFGQVLTETTAAADEDWMTTEAVDFSTEVAFDSPEDDFGFVVVESSNPSGLPANGNRFYWPVRFVETD